jgi:hypothetical protein
MRLLALSNLLDKPAPVIVVVDAAGTADPKKASLT